MTASTFSNENPTNGSYEQALALIWNITIESNSGNTTSANGEITGTKTLEMYELDYCTLYTIWVNTTNNCTNDSSDVYHFTTKDMTASTFSNENPTNGSYEQALALIWNITIESPLGEHFQYFINCSNLDYAHNVS
ncbi:unnamed protein product, partial [marine sediment metagenome]